MKHEFRNLAVRPQFVETWGWNTAKCFSLLMALTQHTAFTSFYFNGHLIISELNLKQLSP